MLKFLSIIFAVYFLTCVLLYLMQRSLLYFPTAEKHQLAATEIWMDTGQAKLKLWTFNEENDAILYFGGNAEDIEDNISDFKRLFPGYSVYLANYRGYGGSSGSPGEAGLFHDAVFIYDQLKNRHRSISVIGRSLGSGVACYLAARRPVSKLLLVTPFDSVKNVAQLHYPYFPVRWLIKDTFDSASRAASIKALTLVLAAQSDQVVPRVSTDRLIAALDASHTRWQIIQGSSHNDISGFAEYYKLVRDFFNNKPD